MKKYPSSTGRKIYGLFGMKLFIAFELISFGGFSYAWIKLSKDQGQSLFNQ